MTETQYIEEIDLILNEVNTAIECFYTYIEIHNYASEDQHIYRAINDDPTFWKINLYSLQNTFFIALGRIYDNGKDAHSIHKLLAATVSHPEFFTKEALGTRKTIGGLKPDWLDTYLSDSFVPQVSDLRDLKKTIASHRSIYNKVYVDIRNLVVAHKILSNQKDIADLFGKTLINEIDLMLYNLRDVLEALQQLIQNGRRPILGSRIYDYKDRIKNGVRKSLGKLTMELKA